MRVCSRGLTILAAAGLSLPMVFGSLAATASVLYEDLPTDPSNEVSFHNTTGPIIADDFAPAKSGKVGLVE